MVSPCLFWLVRDTETDFSSMSALQLNIFQALGKVKLTYYKGVIHYLFIMIFNFSLFGLKYMIKNSFSTYDSFP